MHSTFSLWLTLAWLVLAISIGAIWLLMIMLKRGEAHQVARFFFLVPPLAALQAWLFFNEQWSLLMFIGGVLVLVGLVLGREKTKSEEHTSELQSRGHLVCR